MKLFGWYRDNQQERLPVFAGIQGHEYQHRLEKCQQAFDRALNILKQYSKYALDISIDAQAIWTQQMKR